MAKTDAQILEEGIAQLRLGLDCVQVQQLLRYAALIQKWNKVYNLTAIRNPAELMTHHLLDCLAVLEPLAFELQNHEKPRVLDVGAGAGLPGLVLAIAKPNWQITLIDTVQKKVAFMQQAAGSLTLKNVKTVHARVECHVFEQQFDLICSRAFSSLSNFIELAHPHLNPQGVFAAMKGRQEVDNVVPPPWRIDALHPIDVPFMDEHRHLFMIKR